MSKPLESALANSRINMLFVVIGLFASVTAGVVGYNIGTASKEAIAIEAKRQYSEQMYKICFARERELEMMNSQRARRSCDYLTNALK